MEEIWSFYPAIGRLRRLISTLRCLLHLRFHLRFVSEEQHWWLEGMGTSEAMSAAGRLGGQRFHLFMGTIEAAGICRSSRRWRRSCSTSTAPSATRTPSSSSPSASCCSRCVLSLLHRQRPCDLATLASTMESPSPRSSTAPTSADGTTTPSPASSSRSSTTTRPWSSWITRKHSSESNQSCLNFGTNVQYSNSLSSSVEHPNISVEHKKVRSSLIPSNVLFFDSHDGKIVVLELRPPRAPARLHSSNFRVVLLELQRRREGRSSSGGHRVPAATARGDSSSGGGAREASGPAARGARDRRRGAREAARRLEAASSTGRPAGARL